VAGATVEVAAAVVVAEGGEMQMPYTGVSWIS